MCIVKDCPRGSKLKGYCRAHYDQIRFTGSITREKLDPLPKCKVDNCSNETTSRGYCDRHYQQIYTFKSIRKRTLHDKNEIVVKEDHAEIILYNRKNIEIARTIIDLEDIPKVKEFKWTFMGENSYAKAWNKGKDILLHRFLTEPSELELVDHINGNKLDNRKANLRKCTQSENAMNSRIPANNTSGIKGVYWSKRNNKWEAKIKSKGKNIFLGFYSEKQDAAKARKAAEIKYFGEFRRTSESI